MAASEGPTRVVLNIPNIHCSHCVKTIVRELKRMNAVVSVEGSVEQKQIAVEYEGDILGQIQTKLAEIGYPPA